MTWSIVRLRVPALAALAGTLILLGAGRAEAQIGTWNPNYGSEWIYNPYAGSGPGFGFGMAGLGFDPYGNGYAPGGITVSDMAAMKAQMSALNASRYNLLNAQAASAYEAANLLNQEAAKDAVSGYRSAKQAYGPRYNIRTGSPGYTSSAAPPREAVAQVDPEAQPILPPDRLLAPDGEVLWPVGAPKGPDLDPRREAASQAIRDAVQPGTGGRRGSIRRIVRARERLSDYAVPALQQIRTERPQDEEDFVRYVRSLDLALRALAENRGQTENRGDGPIGQAPAGAPAGTPGRPPARDVDPNDTPKTGGDVLQQTIRQDRDVKEGAPVPLEPKSDRSSARPVPSRARRPVATQPPASTEVTRQAREMAAEAQRAREDAALTTGLPGQPSAAPVLSPPIPPGTLEPSQNVQGRPTNINSTATPPPAPGNLPRGARPAPPVPVPGGVVEPPSQ